MHPRRLHLNRPEKSFQVGFSFGLQKTEFLKTRKVPIFLSDSVPEMGSLGMKLDAVVRIKRFAVDLVSEIQRHSVFPEETLAAALKLVIGNETANRLCAGNGDRLVGKKAFDRVRQKVIIGENRFLPKPAYWLSMVPR